MKVVIEIARVYYDRVLSQVAEQDALVSVSKAPGPFAAGKMAQKWTTWPWFGV